MPKNYSFSNVRAGVADVVDPLQYIRRGMVSRDANSKWQVWVKCPAYRVGDHILLMKKVAEDFRTRAEAASFVIWYDSHRNCGCEWYDGAGNGREMYQVAS